MPRAKRIISADHPYHVCMRCNNQEWFKLPLKEVWNIFSDYLFLIHKLYNVRIHAFVLMSNHFHLLVSTPNANLSEAMNYFLRETSRVISFETHRKNHVFKRPYSSSIIRSNHYFMHAYKYIYRNPADALIVDKVEKYPYSTLYGLLGNDKIIIPVVEDPLLFDQDLDKHLSWLNTNFRDGDREAIKKAMKKHDFRFGILPNKKRHTLETQIS